MVNNILLKKLNFKIFKYLNLSKKIIVIFLATIFTNVIFSQKKIKIDKTTWTYTIPKGFEISNLGLENNIQRGENYIKKIPNHKSSSDDVILLSLTKNDSSDINRVFASYTSNANIKKFTLDLYAKKLEQFFKKNIKNDTLKSKITVTLTQHHINDILFYCITKKTTINKKYRFYSQFYVTEIDNKEFSIVAIFDNEIDKSLIINSILNSEFH